MRCQHANGEFLLRPDQKENKYPTQAKKKSIKNFGYPLSYIFTRVIICFRLKFLINIPHIIGNNNIYYNIFLLHYIHALIYYRIYMHIFFCVWSKNNGLNNTSHSTPRMYHLIVTGRFFISFTLMQQGNHCLLTQSPDLIFWTLEIFNVTFLNALLTNNLYVFIVTPVVVEWFLDLQILHNYKIKTHYEINNGQKK